MVPLLKVWLEKELAATRSALPLGQCIGYAKNQQHHMSNAGALRPWAHSRDTCFAGALRHRASHVHHLCWTLSLRLAAGKLAGSMCLKVCVNLKSRDEAPPFIYDDDQLVDWPDVADACSSMLLARFGAGTLRNPNGELLSALVAVGGLSLLRFSNAVMVELVGVVSPGAGKALHEELLRRETWDAIVLHMLYSVTYCSKYESYKSPQDSSKCSHRGQLRRRCLPRPSCATTEGELLARLRVPRAATLSVGYPRSWNGMPA